MKRLLLIALAIMTGMVVSSGTARATTVGYTFDVTTSYQFGGCAISACANPDTGFLTLTNNGSSTFNGTITLTGVAHGGTSFSDTFTGALAPGASVVFAAGPEGSNQGGFNGSLGATLAINGTVTLGTGSEAVTLSVSDSMIHSGSARVAPCDGISTDAFVLQGGSSTGCDNQDAFETTQANGHFEFFQSAPNTIPEPSSLWLLGSGFLALTTRIKKFVR